MYDTVYRVDAHERARRMIYHPPAPFQRRHLDKAEVTVRDLLGLKEYEEVEESNRIKTAEGTEVLRLQEKFLGVPVFDASLTVTEDNDRHLTGDATGSFIQGIEHDNTNALNLWDDLITSKDTSLLSLPEEKSPDLLGLKEYEEVEESNRIKTAEGTEVLRLQEKFLGVPVFDASLTVTEDKDGHLTGDATGTFIQGIEDEITNVKPKLSKSDVFDIAFKAEGDEIYANSIQPECKIIIFMDEKNKPRLAYYINYRIENKKVIKRPTFVIDGNTGEILLKYNNLNTISRVLTGSGGNEKSGIYKFSEKNHKAFVTQVGKMCFLENNYVKVMDMQNSYGEVSNNTDPIYYVCDAGFNDSANGAISPALDAVYYGSMVSQMFQEWYNISILNKQAILRVHYGENYEGSYWNGKYCTFGDGHTRFYPSTDADVVAHEFAHGFTEQHSGLIYFNQSGSMNEAFSDITGEVTEAYIDKNDWLIGFYIVKDKKSYRFMADPSLDNKSISHVDNFTQNMNPHHGSGIYNFMFYYIVHELKMDIKEAYRVFLIANEIYWHPHSDFTSGACDMLKVAYDLGKDLSPFIKAFERVGIKPCDVEKHIRRLTLNRTASGIRVSVNENPVFDFAYPKWAWNIMITATSMYGKVHIKVSKSNMLTEGNGSDPVTLLAEGTSKLNLGKLEGNKFFVMLSPESRENLENVSLRVTYWCNPHFVSETYIEELMYRDMCGED
ncbi:neutral protease [Octopus bimaculoides]|uniref:neutral protease n=1 Tax=Octopus bimaculoides TaxID=37653 RepID=UPI0022DFC9C1|nr:neutral protease [Octopus bimaculoides]